MPLQGQRLEAGELGEPGEVVVGHLGGRGGGGEGDATTGFGRKASLHRMTAGERQGDFLRQIIQE